MKSSGRPMSVSLRNILALGSIVIGATACASHDASDTPTGSRANHLEGALEDPSVVAKLHDLAVQMAAGGGEPPPTNMYAVAVSDHQAAETALNGGTIYDHVPVFVIVITGGHFTAGHHPYGVPDPEGSVLTVTLDAATYEVTDISIGNETPDLSKVAEATVDLSS